MRLKLDENLGRSLLNLLRAAGHDVTTVWEQGLSSAPDRTLIEICQKERRCLVTLDLDFSNPLLYRPSEYAGIAVLRLPARINLNDLVDAVRTLIAGLEQEDITGKLWIVQKGKIRKYEPV
jgi:predicted nuclease of predicted toxin-antitoxin system